MRCLLLDLEERDQKMSLKADFLVAQQLPDRKDIFHDSQIQKAELEELEKTKAVITQFVIQMNEPLQRYDEVPKNANIREEFQVVIHLLSGSACEFLIFVSKKAII